MRNQGAGDREIGWWNGKSIPETGEDAIHKAILQVTSPIFLVDDMEGRYAVSREGSASIHSMKNQTTGDYRLLAYVPPLHPKDLGEKRFKLTHGLKYPYVCGAMANGITSVDMVEKAGKAGMVGFFGAGGLSLTKIEEAVHDLKNRMGELPFGFNLIHSPGDPAHEAAVVNLYLNNDINLISASAYLNLTLPLVYYRVKGIHQDSQGNILCPHKVIAKISRVEVAAKFLSPPPEKMLAQLVKDRYLTEQEANLAKYIPVAEDMTAEADSGGHTDNRPAMALLPTIMELRDELAEQFKYQRVPCVGLGGGISTPSAAAAAFAMGAAYILTGSVNQSCIEAGTSTIVRKMLLEAGQADVAMAPAADMFEMGAKVQVLKRGTMFPLRASKLYDLYNRYGQYEDIPLSQRESLEKDFFKCGFHEEWENTKRYFETMDPRQIERGEKDPKHKMALVFRSYLGQSSLWAKHGDPARQMDFQIWCGPSMGAFNQWVKGSFLDGIENRKTVTVAKNLLMGASVVLRLSMLKNQDIVLPGKVGRFLPMIEDELNTLVPDL
ncbi:MAG: PfaD family polyunsaturated fatty acid/polyketide biosynthesis protein [Desulfobacteraceae bacterium]|nr:PfaD family polyunsaturated fatty acid/polyketide biosynthesis protein [Desulfobacteraceae bacterium]